MNNVTLAALLAAGAALWGQIRAMASTAAGFFMTTAGARIVLGRELR